MKRISVNHRSRFTLLEVLIAFAVAGIGMISVLSFMYMVYQTSRHAVVESKIGYASSRFFSFIENTVQAEWTNLVHVVDGTFELPVFSGGVHNKDSLYDAVDDPGWTAASSPEIFSHASRAGLYKMQDDDYAFSVRIWQSGVSNNVLNDGGGFTAVAMSDSDVVNLFGEFSWPLTKSYGSRKKWYFSHTVLRATN